MEMTREINNNEPRLHKEQSKTHQRKDEKIVELKIFKFTLKLTNWRKLDKNDYAMLLGMTLMLMFYILAILYLPCVLLLLYFYPPSAILVLLYYIWVYFDRVEIDKDRKRFSPIIREFIEKVVANFPLRVIKTADLPTNKNYLWASYPHGVIPFYTFPNHIISADKKDKLFPGISIRFVIHDAYFYVPVMREFFLKALDCYPCSASNLKEILNSKPSKAAILFPGGAAEVCLTKIGDTYRILKTQRKGFIRIALQTGASLVPVFTFNAINLWNTYSYSLRSDGKSIFGIPIFLLNGRGYFQHNFGILPHCIPLTTVVGKPISVPKVENPSSELINEFHEKFFDALQSLFDEHKQKYDIAGENAKLKMI